MLRSLGLTRRLQEPAQIFNGVLHEGEEITLAANLELRQGSIHGGAAIELHGADPYKFAQFRELGLVNEQIAWKQLFFVPTDEAKGVAVLSELLSRCPVVVTDEMPDEVEAHAASRETDGQLETGAIKVVDLENWIIEAGETAAPLGEIEETSSTVLEGVREHAATLDRMNEPGAIRQHEPCEQPLLFAPQPAKDLPVKPTTPARGKDTGQLTFDFTESESLDALAFGHELAAA